MENLTHAQIKPTEKLIYACVRILLGIVGVLCNG